MKKGLSEVTSTLIGLKILLVYSDLPLGLLIELVISGTGLSEGERDSTPTNLGLRSKYF